MVPIDVSISELQQEQRAHRGNLRMHNRYRNRAQIKRSSRVFCRPEIESAKIQSLVPLRWKHCMRGLG